MYEVPPYDEESTTPQATLIATLGTITTIANEFTSKKFILPQMDSAKLYMVVVFSKAKTYYFTELALQPSDVHGFTIYKTGANTANVEAYQGTNHGRGGYAWSFFQERFV